MSAGEGEGGRREEGGREGRERKEIKMYREHTNGRLVWYNVTFASLINQINISVLP